ncbi:MAG TPA: tRNA (guanosine(46)-N7)-methyltransferase TrmB [Actinomycetaceae bacterium]|nr:tRNA (guanosine(46)-N7)-methyltransferase TrmB [Actinomycetaceae bacterium]
MSNRSFARTGGRLSPPEARAISEHGRRYLIGADSDGYVATLHPPRLELADLFPDDDAPLVIEIGAGIGQQAVGYANAHPERNVLAVEVWREGLGATVLRAVKAELTNLRLIQADAATLFGASLPDQCATEVWIFFPDPWPKKRHHKRRLVNPAFAASVARVLVPGGVWRMATDWENYAEQMRDVVAGAGEFFSPDPSADADGFSPRWDERVLTRYERRGVAAGRQIRDVMAHRLP